MSYLWGGKRPYSVAKGNVLVNFSIGKEAEYEGAASKI